MATNQQDLLERTRRRTRTPSDQEAPTSLVERIRKRSAFVEEVAAPTAKPSFRDRATATLGKIASTLLTGHEADQFYPSTAGRSWWEPGKKEFRVYPHEDDPHEDLAPPSKVPTGAERRRRTDEVFAKTGGRPEIPTTLPTLKPTEPDTTRAATGAERKARAGGILSRVRADFPEPDPQAMEGAAQREEAARRLTPGMAELGVGEAPDVPEDIASVRDMYIAGFVPGKAGERMEDRVLEEAPESMRGPEGADVYAAAATAGRISRFPLEVKLLGPLAARAGGAVSRGIGEILGKSGRALAAKAGGGLIARVSQGLGIPQKLGPIAEAYPKTATTITGAAAGAGGGLAFGAGMAGIEAAGDIAGGEQPVEAAAERIKELAVSVPAYLLLGGVLGGLGATAARQRFERGLSESEELTSVRDLLGIKRDPLSVLGLRTDATKEQISARRRDLSQSLHPDKGGSNEAMAVVNAAAEEALAGAYPARPEGPAKAAQKAPEAGAEEVSQRPTERRALEARPDLPTAETTAEERAFTEMRHRIASMKERGQDVPDAEGMVQIYETILAVEVGGAPEAEVEAPPVAPEAAEAVEDPAVEAEAVTPAREVEAPTRTSAGGIDISGYQPGQDLVQGEDITPGPIEGAVEPVSGSEVDINAATLENRRLLLEAEGPPAAGAYPEVGTFGNDYGDLAIVQDIALDDPRLQLPEVGTENQAIVDRYAEWAQAGSPIPLVRVLETDQGNLKMQEGHHRIRAARQAGQETIRAWVVLTDPNTKMGIPVEEVAPPPTPEAALETDQMKADVAKMEEGVPGPGHAEVLLERLGTQKKVEGVPKADVLPDIGPDVAMMPASSMKRDAKRMQYRGDSDPTGVTRTLRKVKTWKEESQSVLTVWKDPESGEVVVVDGHQRHGLAERLGYEGPLLVRFSKAETAADARVEGALINIRAGNGTAVDAAKLFRDLGLNREELKAFLEKEGIPLTNTISNGGLAMSNLAQSIFDAVAMGRMTVEKGIIVGEAGLTHEQQVALMKMPKVDSMGAGALAELARFVKEAGSEAVQQETLFGTETFDIALAPEKAKLSAWVKEKLGKDRRLLRTVGDEAKAARLSELGVAEVEVERADRLAGQAAQTEELFHRLSTRSGPVSEALNEAASQITKGVKRDVVQKELYTAVQAGIIQTLEGAGLEGAAEVRGPGEERGFGPGGEQGRVGEGAEPTDLFGEGPGEVREAPVPTPAAEAIQEGETIPVVGLGKDKTVRRLREGEDAESAADEVLAGKALPAVQADDGTIYTRRTPAEHGDLVPMAEDAFEASFSEKDTNVSGWIVSGDRYVSLGDVQELLAPGEKPEAKAKEAPTPTPEVAAGPELLAEVEKAPATKVVREPPPPPPPPPTEPPGPAEEPAAEPPPRAGPPKVESTRKAIERLRRNRGRLAALADRIGTKKRAPAGEELRTEVANLVEGVLVPRQVQKLLDRSLAVKTKLQARKVVLRAQLLVDRELHRRVVDELQTVYKEAIGKKLRPEFLEGVNLAVADIDMKVLNPKLRNALRKTAKYLELHPESPLPDKVLDQLARLNQTSLKELSIDEIEAITDAVRMAMHLNRLKNKMHGLKRGRERGAVSEKAVSEMEDRIPELKQSRDRSTGLEGPPKRSTLSLFLREVGTRPEVLLEHLSPTLQDLVWEDVTVQAHADEQSLVWDFRDALKDAIEATGHKTGVEAFEKWRTEPMMLTTKDGPVQISRSEAIWLLTTMKDPSNLALIYKNGVTLNRSDRSFAVDEGTVSSLQAITGEAEADIADFLFTQFNGPMKEALNEPWVKVYGFEIARVPDYVPRSIDMTRAETGKDPLEQMAADRSATITTWGHLRERVGAAAPLRIGDAFEIYENHAGHVSRIGAYLPSVTNAYAILGRPDVKRAMIERVGREGYDRILGSIAMQTVRFHDRTAGERWLRWRLRLFGASTLGFRASTLMLNPSGLSISAGYQENGFENLAKALPSGTNPKEWKRISGLAKRFSPYWRSRYESFVHQSTSGLVPEKKSTLGRPSLAEYALVPLQKSDQFGAVVRWKMAELHVARTQPDLKAGSDAFHNEVAREWERLMFRGENTAHGGDMTGALAFGRRNIFFAPFVMFTSSVSKIYSMAVRSSLAAQRGDYKIAISSFAGFLIATAWAALVRELLKSLRSSDEDDEKISERVALRMATEASGYVPVLGPAVIAPSIRKLAGKPGPTFSANIVDDVLSDMAGSIGSVIKATETALTGELDAQGEKVFTKNLTRAVDGMLQLTAVWFGAPYGGPKDALRMVRNVTRDAPTELRTQLRDLQSDADITQERRLLLRSIRHNDPEEFRKAIQKMREKGVATTHNEVLATINRRYGFLTKYERGEPARRGLDAMALELIDQHIAEREELRKLAERLARENSDILSRSRTLPPRPGPSKPKAPKRPGPSRPRG